ncbi:hypothetical protein CCMSSC00406_0003387 [Pleurotus cornucopiae]|uniref:Uncharacterized protein n=1 Tax=Pleurotus cornucopiae TaxID=5321 RepID=A0ACB7J9T3_PLECO|nr:hypothetical protein CCMSSC00406_0003387 [Pleurotus cornucopiae]
MPQPYIHSFAHIPTVRSKFPSRNASSHTHEEGDGQLPEPQFDVVVVGGGPSGCALATRLYERTQGRVSVLLLEAAMHPEESPELNNCVPRILQTRALHRSAFDYAYPTEHEHEHDLADHDNSKQEREEQGRKEGRRALVLNSGKVLGGSTCINFGIWTKGAKADYDLWASLVGSDEFSWAKMAPCFDRVASLSSCSPPHSTPTSPIKTRLISQSPRLHHWSGIARRGLDESGFLLLGSGGINGGLAEINSSHSDSSIDRVKDVFGEMTECVDREQVRSTALGYFEDVIDPLLLPQDSNTTSASSPATPATPARGKFEVWTSLRVERVVFDEVEGRKEGKKAVGVQTRFGVIRARREVILCAGAIQSPYILLQSGIGPAPHLAARGVPLVHDSPGVGRNLWEHPFVDVRAKLRPTHRKDTVETFASLMTSAPHLHQWSTERTGLMSGLPYEWLAYSNMHAELSPLFTSPSPSPSQPSSASSPSPSASIPPTPTDTHVLLRSNSPHIEHLIHYGHGLAPAPDAMASSYIAVSTVLLVPRSRGYVEIPPTSPETGVEGSGESLVDEKPRIVVNQLKDPIDRRVLREAVRRAFAVLGAPAWREYLEDVGEKGDAELDDIVRQRVTTLWHYGGTCAMKTSTSTLGDGVVDTRFRVEGVEGLRVADTSVIPFPVAGHTQAVAYAIGEKGKLVTVEYLVRWTPSVSLHLPETPPVILDNSMVSRSSQRILPLVILALSLVSAASAFNDWSVPCFHGECAYDASSSTVGSGTVQLFGSPKGLTDITPAAGWVILDCDPNALDQTIRLVCMNEDEEACGHLFAHGGPQDKVVRLPESCGAGPFARIAHLSTAEDQSIPAHVSPKIVRRDGATPQVISLGVDTNWLSIDTENRGEIQFRIAGINGEHPAGHFHDGGLHSREDSKTWFQSALVKVAKAAVALGEHFKDKPFFASDANGVEASKTFDKTIPIFEKNATCGPLKGTLKVEVAAKGSIKGNIGFVAAGKLGKEPETDDMATLYRLTLDADASFTVIAKVAGSEKRPIHILDLPLGPFVIPGIAEFGPKIVLDALGEAELQLTSDSVVGGNFNIDLQYVIPQKYSQQVKDVLKQDALTKPKDSKFSLRAATDVVGTAKFKGHLIPKIQVGIKAFAHEADVYAKVDIWAALYLLAKGHASAGVSGSKKLREIADRAYTPPYAIAQRDLDATKATAGFTGSVIINAGVEVSGGVEVKGKAVPFFKALAGLKVDEPLGIGAKAGKAWQLLSKDFGVGQYSSELAKASHQPISASDTCPTKPPSSTTEVVQAVTTLAASTFKKA